MLKLIVVRHAPAEDRAEFARSGRSDGERPLTARGREKMLTNARGLHVVIPALDVLATSPCTRAVETADIIATQYEGVELERVSVLAPGARREDFLEWLRGVGRKASTICIVGHEPDLGELVGWLGTGRASPPFAFKKGGAAMLELTPPATPGQAALRWLLSPAVLRSLAQ